MRTAKNTECYTQNDPLTSAHTEVSGSFVLKNDMEALELRIGNKLIWGDGYIDVDINIFRDFDVYNKNGLTPIPLTEEILLKCGAKQINEYWFEFHTYGIIKHTSFIEFYSCVEGDYICNSVKYLHQLQNLYFDLIGEELIIEL